MTTPNIYVALSSFAQSSSKPLELLKESRCRYRINTGGTRLEKQQVIEVLQGYDGVIAGLEPYDAQVIQALPQLKCISRCGVGIDNIDIAAARKQNIAVFNTPDAVVEPVAELTVAMIFDLLRNVTIHAQFMRQRQWVKRTGQQLRGKTIGIIGLGRIGRRVAVMLQGLGCRVIAFDIQPDTAWAHAHQIILTGLEDLLSQSDVISLHVTVSQGQGLCLSRRHFAQMKKGSYLVNTARGALLDEQDLAEALNQGHLAGAALDVYSQEPYQGPLCDLPQVILTPHVATLTQESRAQMETEAVLNALNFFKP